MIRWDILDVNRHGSYGRKLAKVWDHDYKGGRVPFVGKGLSFMMSGTDFVRAAALLSRFSGDEKPMVWARRLAKRYMDARHPATGLGASNFSTRPDERMRKQFAHFDGRFTEATVTDLYGARYTYCALCLLRLGETLGKQGKGFLQWGLEDLAACATHTYDAATHSFWPALIDGTKLTPADRKREGYVKERWLRKRRADGRHFLAYALAYRLSSDPLMWRMTRSIGQALGLGDLGEEESIRRDTASSDPLVLFALLELYEATRWKAYLDLAQRVGDNALASRVHKGLFVESQAHVYARLDDPTPLALLHLRATTLGLKQRPPAFWGGRGYFHCPYDGEGRTYDVRVIYTQRRGTPPGP